MKRVFAISISLLLSISYALAQQNMFHPTETYISQHTGKWEIEVPEGQELMQIILALTPTGKADSGLINHNTAYYQEVISTFAAFAKHPAVIKVEKLLNKDHAWYYYLNMDAAGYYFDEKNQLVRDNTYDQLSWKNKNAIPPLQKLLQSFADDSKFTDFYSGYKSYYDSLKTEMQSQLPVDIQWQWLENNFPERYQHYRILFSPLIWGSHSTRFFEAPGFKQTVMFVNGPISNNKYSDAVIVGLMTRVVFTEIDHNYVNPVTELYKARINQIFADRSKWTNDAKGADWYENPYMVFNEYMTWSVFTLYAMDKFGDDDFKVINDKTEKQMVEQRGFPAYVAFNCHLMELYQSKSREQTIADLIPLMLDWCAQQ